MEMNRMLQSTVRCALAATLLGAVGAAHAQVGVSVGVNAPGVYGQINIGGMPAPELLLPQAVVAVPPPVVVGVAPPLPLYLHVPPGYERHWRRHCAEYHACGRPVYFVSENWYRSVYVPHRAAPPPRPMVHDVHRDEHVRAEEHRADERRAHEEHHDDHDQR